MISGGANVNARSWLTYSALHHAAWAGQTEVVRLLLDNGACDDERTDDGSTPLALAAHVLKLLIRHGC